jgi:hypothetical protein
MTTPLKTRILLADDHAVVRKGLRLVLDAEPDLEVAGEAADGAEAVELGGLLLIFTAVQLFRHRDRQPSIEGNPLVTAAQRVLPFTDRYHGDSLVVRLGGKRVQLDPGDPDRPVARGDRAGARRNDGGEPCPAAGAAVGGEMEADGEALSVPAASARASAAAAVLFVPGDAARPSRGSTAGLTPDTSSEPASPGLSERCTPAELVVYGRPAKWY